MKEIFRTEDIKKNIDEKCGLVLQIRIILNYAIECKYSKTKNFDLLACIRSIYCFNIYHQNSFPPAKMIVFPHKRNQQYISPSVHNDFTESKLQHIAISFCIHALVAL